MTSHRNFLIVTFFSAGFAMNAANGQCDQWHPLTSGGQIGVSSTIHAVTVWNGELVAGGLFVTAGGQTVNTIARWDGAAWQPIAAGGQTGVGGFIHDLTVWNGDLIACGVFATAGGQTVNNIARWNGSTWQPFTSGGQIGIAGRALAVYNGDLIAGGTFATAGGQTVNNIARWNGSAWLPLASGGQTGVAGATGGHFSIMTLTVYNGELIAGGGLTSAGGQTMNHIARWNGSAWQPFNSGGQIGANDAVYDLATWNNELIAGGMFTTVGGQTVNNIARWNGITEEWQPLTSGGQIGVNSRVYALAEWNGDLIAGGLFTTAGGQTVNGIARWDNVAWNAFTSGGEIGVGGNRVGALAVWNDDLIAGGLFNTAGGQTMNNIARWDYCPPAPCPADITGNGTVNVEDLLAVIGAWGACPDPCPPHCPADLNQNCTVNVQDLLAVIGAWGSCP